MFTEITSGPHIHKFRVSRKPPEVEAARLRDNQRRHRARVKARAEELEAVLAATQKKLDDALRHVDALTAEVRQLRNAVQHPPTHTQLQLSPPSTSTLSPQASLPSIDSLNAVCRPASTNEPEPSTSCRGCGCHKRCPDRSPLLGTHHDAISLPASLPSTQPGHDRSDLVTSEVNSLEDDCAFLPPPSPGESTILCRDAYSIIKQRLSDVDIDAVTESLKPGFRRAIAPGSGCRVQTHILFSFVDQIT